MNQSQDLIVTNSRLLLRLQSETMCVPVGNRESRPIFKKKLSPSLEVINKPIYCNINHLLCVGIALSVCFHLSVTE